MARPDTPRLPAPSTLGEDCAFAAQALGQPGARRGLREGAPALKRARDAYLCAEWSGEDDRRPPAGMLRRERV